MVEGKGSRNIPGGNSQYLENHLRLHHEGPCWSGSLVAHNKERKKKEKKRKKERKGVGFKQCVITGLVSIIYMTSSNRGQKWQVAITGSQPTLPKCHGRDVDANLVVGV